MEGRLTSRIDDNFTDWTAERYLQTIQNIAAQDAFTADKVRLQSARILLPIQQCPDLKCERCRRSACNPTDQSLHAQTRSQLKELTIRPRQDARIRPSIGNDSIQDDPR